jgi:hypothetical protein
MPLVASPATRLRGGKLASVLAASSAPWWGAALFTVVGGLLGGLLTQGINVWNDRRKASDAHSAAMRGIERDALVRFMTTINRICDALSEADVPSYDWNVLNQAWTEIQLISDTETNAAVRDVMIRLDAFSQELDEVGGNLFELGSYPHQPLVEARDSLLAVVRKTHALAGVKDA